MSFFIIGNCYLDRRGRYTVIGPRTIRYDETGQEAPIHNLEIKQQIHRAIVFAQEHPEFGLTPKELRARNKVKRVRKMDKLRDELLARPAREDEFVPSEFAVLEEDVMEQYQDYEESEEVCDELIIAADGMDS